jgi:hypothetical protein
MEEILKRFSIFFLILTLLAIGCTYNKPRPISYTLGGMMWPVDTVSDLEFRIRLFSNKISPNDSGKTKSELSGTLDITCLMNRDIPFGDDSTLLIRIDSLSAVFEGQTKKEYTMPLTRVISCKYKGDGTIRNTAPIFLPPLDCPSDKGDLLMQYNISIIASDESSVLATKFIEHRLYRNPEDSARYRWTTDPSLYASPFSPTTTVSYEIPTDGPVLIVIYNYLGKEVDTLVNEVQAAGRHDIKWNADSSIPSGVYFYKITTADFSATKKMILLR